MQHGEYVRICEDSQNAVLLIHGIVGTPRHFDRFLDAIAQDWSVYNILLDGHGGTVRDFARTSMIQWKRQVENCLQQLCGQYERVVVIAHSMGTLLTLEAAPAYPQVKAAILLNVPLRPRVTADMAARAVRFALGRLDESDVLDTAIRDATGVAPEKRLWRYLSWIPRFWELLRLCRVTRRHIRQVRLPCHIFQSRRDELVSMKSVAYLKDYTVLEDSCHFYYSPADTETIRTCVKKVLSQ